MPLPRLIAVPLNNPDEVVMVAVNPFELVILLSVPNVKLLVKLCVGFPNCRMERPPAGRCNSGVPFVKE